MCSLPCISATPYCCHLQIYNSVCTTAIVTMFAAGIEKVHSLPSGLSSYEQDALKKCMPELADSIQKGIDFAKSG